MGTQNAANPPHSSSQAGASDRLPRNVWVLGWVAFFNDTATEMSYWLLPQFLVSVLHASTIAFGLIEGAAETVSSLGRLASGFLADRYQRRKPFAALGYTVANLSKPLLALAQTWPQVFWIRFADRAAKGFRAAPRDALIVESVPASQRGSAFGLRQAMDSAGAVLGPLMAILLLRAFLGNVRNVFWAASIPGLASLLLAWIAVREVRPLEAATRDASRKVFALFREGNSRLLMILAAVTLFSLGNSSDLFLVLRAQNLGLRAGWVPALGLLFNTVYTGLSWPAGKLSDRISRRILIAGGYAVYAAVYLGFALLKTSKYVWPLFALYGSYYAMSEGTLRAWIADLAPAHARASVFGVFNWVVGMAAFPASLLAGWLWQHVAAPAPFYLSAGTAAIASLLLLLV